LIRMILSDKQWERIAPALPDKAGDPGVNRTGQSTFFRSRLVARADRRAVKCRRNSARGVPSTRAFWWWVHKGVWERVFKLLSDHPDLE
jgi:hypothetical protein